MYPAFVSLDLLKLGVHGYSTPLHFLLWQVINARQNQLKNSGIPSDIFGLEDLLTIVGFNDCYISLIPYLYLTFKPKLFG